MNNARDEVKTNNEKNYEKHTNAYMHKLCENIKQSYGSRTL